MPPVPPDQDVARAHHRETYLCAADGGFSGTRGDVIVGVQGVVGVVLVRQYQDIVAMRRVGVEAQ